MCGRYAQGKAIQNLLSRYAELGLAFIAYDQLPPVNFNITPTTLSPVVFVEESAVRMAAMRWGFIPRWTVNLDPKQPRPINAKSESAATSPFFRDAFRHARCLVPAMGFYEWKGTKPPKQPYFIHARDQEILSFAGLWSRWNAPDGSSTLTYTILTTQANAAVEQIHNRMPCILRPEEEKAWISPETSPADAQALLRPYPADQTASYPVSTAVNKPGNNGEALLTPMAVRESRVDDLFSE